MKLKEKLAKIILVPLENQGFYINWDKVEKCEQIADDFAVEFGEWLLSRATGEEGLKLRDDILEIFKKEKGL